MTANGVKIVEGRPKADCLDRGKSCKGSLCGTSGYHGPVYNCDAAGHFNRGSGGSAPASGRTRIDQDKFGRTVLPQGFRINDLEYDTDYCFRFKARRASDGVVSEAWSNWACVHTAANPPPKPSAPQGVVADYIAGGIDWRIKPPKVALKWTMAGGAGQTVQKKSEAWETKSFSEVKKLDRYATEFVDVLAEKDFFPDGRASTIFYRICAVNISGTTCSQPASTFRPPLDVEQEGPGVGETLDELKPKESVEVSPGQGVGDVLKETTPPASAEKLGVTKKSNKGIGEILKEVQPPASEESAPHPHGGAGDVFRQ